MTDDDLEQRLRSHFRAIDPGRAPRGLAVTIGEALERRPNRPAFTVRARPAFAVALAVVLVVGLGLGLGLRPGGFLSSAVMPSSPTPVPSPKVECSELAAADCAPAAKAALSAIAGQGGLPIRVDLGSGVFCPTPGLLFEHTTCPGGSLPPPEGGQWIGHALVTFEGSVAQGYLNIAKNGSTFRAALIAVATPAPSTIGPDITFASAIPAPRPVASSVAFFDTARGLVVGATPSGEAAVWRTGDGGGTWAETDLAMPPLAFVTVSEPSSAWATVQCPNPAWTGDTCSVIASSDGGVTWHTVSDRKLVGLSFVDAENGWGVVFGGPSPGGGALFSTADGGRTWTVLPASPCREIGWPVSVSFVDRRHGWVGCAGMAGAGQAPKGIAETTDGGRTWTVRARVTPPSGPVGSISVSDYLDGIAMRPSGVGLAWEGRGGTLRTTDGGRTWTPMPPGGSDAGPIPAGGWAITDRDWLILLWDPNAQTTVLYATDDGGATWRVVSHVPGTP